MAPAERVTIHQAMRMKTVDAAYVLGLDDLIGSITAGKFADFTVLTEDPYEVAERDPMRLRDIKVWGTVLGGKLRPQADEWQLEEVPPEGLIPGVMWLAQRESSGNGPWIRAMAAFALNLSQSPEAFCRTLLHFALALILIAIVSAAVFGAVIIPAILSLLALGAVILRSKRQKKDDMERPMTVKRKYSDQSATSTSESAGLSNSDSDDQTSNAATTSASNLRRRPPQRK